MRLSPVVWDSATNKVKLINQCLLPQELSFIDYDDVKLLAGAITDMVVRGAPAIGIAAAYGVVLAARSAYAQSAAEWRSVIKDDLVLLKSSRPTAVNLQWTVDKMSSTFESINGDPEPQLLALAKSIQEEDIAANIIMSELGAKLIEDKCRVFTHCNTGALATGGYGTALGVIRTAYSQGRIKKIFVSETRPQLQGARLTAWELQRENMPVALLVDSAVGYLCSYGKVEWFIAGADRIAANGDVCNKIGTYAHAFMARHHSVRVMIVAPSSSFDLDTATGKDIPIEYRSEDEILSVSGIRVAPDNISAWNPVFDITPASLIDYIVTEKGVIASPDESKIKTLLS